MRAPPTAEKHRDNGAFSVHRPWPSKWHRERSMAMTWRCTSDVNVFFTIVSAKKSVRDSSKIIASHFPADRSAFWPRGSSNTWRPSTGNVPRNWLRPCAKMAAIQCTSTPPVKMGVVRPWSSTMAGADGRWVHGKYRPNAPSWFCHGCSRSPMPSDRRARSCAILAAP